MCDMMILQEKPYMVAIIDADLIGRKKHRFPNLVCMKLSGYWKEKDAHVELKTDYEGLEFYDKVYISKVFTDTPIDERILEYENVEYGGTGFFFDKAPNLPNEIEHHMPDYHLYDEWVYKQIEDGVKSTEFKEYLDYSIGFITRGCFRKCPFCVNQKYDHVFEHSPLEEFYDPTRKKICLLDDNFLGFSDWKSYLQCLIDTSKKFKFKQGMDERLLTDEKCELLFNANYDGDLTFAFDKISDYPLIEKKLLMIRRHTEKQCMFYVLVGFESTDTTDIENAFKRIDLLRSYHCLPYIMRFQNKNETPWKDSEWRGMYITLARWCNQPSIFKKKSFREFCHMIGNDASLRYATKFEEKHPDLTSKYFDIK